jgi:hypothetical protein
MKASKYTNLIYEILLNYYRLIVERRFGRSSDPEIYASGSVSAW